VIKAEKREEVDGVVANEYSEESTNKAVAVQGFYMPAKA